MVTPLARSLKPNHDGTGGKPPAVRSRPILVLLSLAVVSTAAVSAWFLLVPSSASVNVDDGVYAIQGLALQSGDLSVPHVLADVDPNGHSHPYVRTIGGSVTGDGFYLQPRHGVWSRVVAESRSIFGLIGLRLPSALGLAMTGAASFFIAKAAGRPQSASLAAALVLLSPILFNALQLWAHTAIAAAIALALLGSLWLLRDGPTRGAMLLVAAGCAVASMLRGDGAIFAVAIGIALLLQALLRRERRLALSGGGILLVSVAAYGATTWYLADRIDSSTLVSGSNLVTEATRPRSAPAIDAWLRGALSTLFTNLRYGGWISASLLLISALLVGGAALTLRRGRLRDSVWLLMAAAGVLLIRIAVLTGSHLAATGLLGGWPIAMLVLAVPIRNRPSSERFLFSVVALGITGVVLTQYSIGGGLNWGGRYVSYAIPAIAVLVASGLYQSVPPAARRGSPLLVAVGAVVLASTVGMLKLDQDTRLRNDSFLASLDGMAPTLPVVTSNRYFPLLDWAAFPERQWLQVPPPDHGGAEQLMSMLREAGIRRVILFDVDAATLQELAPGYADTTESHGGGRLSPLVVDIGAG